MQMYDINHFEVKNICIQCAFHLKHTRALEILQINRSRDQFFGAVDLNEMIMCLEDLINYFAQPEDDMGKRENFAHISHFNV